tara:strand:- start:2587 stop:3477 length:891 start_codon:yes stop_codon:yes gene_type:complete
MLHLEQLADTPTGVSASTMPLTRARARWLQQLDRDPSALLTQLSSRPTHRLGVYFEQLWHFFLRSDPAVELVAHNLAIHDEGRTLGEFDCIYYCADRACHVHLELAVKYFLGVPRARDNATPANTHEWLGPDQRDRLKTKLDQLLQRQIALGDAPAARRKLLDMGIENMAREIALKGYLFQPLYEAPPSPPGFNRACTMHKWVSYQQLESHCATLDAMSFAILPKMQWLSRAQCDASETRLTQQQLLASLPRRWQADHYPLLIAALDEAHSEVSRFFVTPGRWPDSIARSATRSAL